MNICTINSLLELCKTEQLTTDTKNDICNFLQQLVRQHCTVTIKCYGFDGNKITVLKRVRTLDQCSQSLGHYNDFMNGDKELRVLPSVYYELRKDPDITIGLE